MKTILIIEDSPEIRENTAELLALNNYAVVTAADGASGFALARRTAPDLVLCDMMMPETNGRFFLKMVKADKDLRHVPVIFFSAGTLSANDQYNLAKAADGFLKKPFMEKDLLQSIQDVLNKKKNQPV